MSGAVKGGMKNHVLKGSNIKMITIRMTEEMHSDLIEESYRQRKSMNLLCVEIFDKVLSSPRGTPVSLVDPPAKSVENS